MLVGIPVSRRFDPTTRAYSEPRLASSESLQTIGLISWFPLPVANDRTIVNRSAMLASLGNVPPNVMPGSFVATSPVALDTPDGAVSLGSKVSVWLGPPCKKRKTTARSRTASESSVACARAAIICANDNPPSDIAPTRRKSRRPVRAGSMKRSMNKPEAAANTIAFQNGTSTPIVSTIADEWPALIARLRVCRSDDCCNRSDDAEDHEDEQEDFPEAPGAFSLNFSGCGIDEYLKGTVLIAVGEHPDRQE